MPNFLVIDGYNLLGCLGTRPPERSADGDQVREVLIQRLSLYSQRKGHPVTVVFDAWRGSAGLERHEHRTGVHVVFTKRGERADQVIQRLAREHGRACAVVSSDLEIIQTARAHGAFVMKSQEFQVKLESLWNENAAAGKSQPLSTRHRQIEDEGPQGRGRADKKGNPRKLPKAVRARNRQLRGF